MRFIPYIIMFFVNVIGFSQVFNNANAAYKQEKYSQAESSYTSILKQDKVHSAALYFNLANTYYKLNQIAPAIYFYEKALLLQPNNTSVKNNLTFAQKRTVDDIKNVPQVGFAQILNKFSQNLSYNTWAYLAAISSLLIVLFFAVYYFNNNINTKRIFFALQFVALFFVIFFMFFSVWRKNYDNSYNPAIIFSNSVALKAEPNNSAETVTTLHEGTKVFITENLDQWLQITLTDNTKGWLQKKDLKEIKKNY